ncbi:hypothetical protein TrST_g214 [Triparma strigata]|uniref:Uncharacterized protein n=1 Tax=Triparma strigata TaxID=1606541 RepID=A0A9W7E5E5_9STRA|nr:hypothetical protein TrST_g214 [Triparma strigata]
MTSLTLILLFIAVQFQSTFTFQSHSRPQVSANYATKQNTATNLKTKSRVAAADTSLADDTCSRSVCPEPELDVTDDDSRREVLFSMLGAATAVASTTIDRSSFSANAAIPIYSEDYDPSAKPKKIVPTGPPKPPAPELPFSKSKDKKQRLKVEAEYLCKLVDAGSWDTVRNYILEPGSYLHDTKKSTLEIRGPVQELEDFSLSVRTIFFNEEDKSQVLKMEEDSGYSDQKNVEEGRRLLMAVVDGINEMT